MTQLLRCNRVDQSNDCLVQRREFLLDISQRFATAPGSSSASHATVDQCGQVGFVINNFGLRDYDPSGIQIAESNFSANANSTDDLLLLPDDDLLRTLRQARRLARDDPHPHLFVVVEELSVDGYPWIFSLFSSLRRSRRRTECERMTHFFFSL